MPNSTCSVDGCDTRERCKGFCNKHYLRFRIHGDPLFRFKPEGKQVCTAPSCGSFVHTKGLCVTHAARLRRTGTPADPVKEKKLCSVEGCSRKHYGKMMCQRHYLRVRAGLPLRLPSDVIAGKRMCSRCFKDLPLESFGVSTKISGGRNIYCSSCLSDIGHIRRANKRANAYESVNRDVVLERDHWICYLCGDNIPAAEKWPAPLSASMDHVIPLARGGAHTYENIKSAHLSCNISKGARIPV